jgi:hypothetical protein
MTLLGVPQSHPGAREAQAALTQTLLWFAGLTYLLTCAILMTFLPPMVVMAQAAVLVGIYLAWRWPAGVIAAILLLAPLQPLSTMILKAAGFDWVTAASSLKELGLFAAVIVLASRVRLHLAALDFIVLALFGWAVLVSCLQSNSDTLISLKDDFGFLLSFYAGRLILLNRGWIRAGLWMAGAIAFLGLIEFFVIGPEMRLLLMRVTDPTQLATSFRAESFSGIRAASTLASPLEFGGYCAIGLIGFAAFHQELGKKYLLPALLLACGLLVSLTRMAWLGAFLGLTLVAYRQRRIRQLALIALSAVLLAGFTLVPYLDLSDYVNRTLSGAEQSERGHALSLVEKSEYVLAHPLGEGAGSVGPRAAERNSKAIEVESSFLMFGIAYGWPGLLLFSGFYVALALTLLPKCSTIGLAASAVAVAMGCMLMLSPIHIEFPLNSWVWVLLGFATGEPSSQWSWRFPKTRAENPCPQPLLP